MLCIASVSENRGYSPEVINYKPLRQDDNLYNFFRFRKFKNLASYLLNRRRERQLCRFRSERLIMSSERLRTMGEVQQYVKDFDVLISGSDKVLNPSSLLYCEAYGGKGGGVPCLLSWIPLRREKNRLCS